LPPPIVTSSARRSGVRLFHYWERVKESLWFIPSVLTLLSILAAHFTLRIDRNLEDPDAIRELALVVTVGAEGARATLSAIAQSVITVTGVVFSVTIVALQLAASQFTPRVLRTFLADRANQTVLGIFIATFTYTLLVERTVGSAPGEDEAFVPAISVTISIFLMLVSIGALIFFINHIAQSIRASVIVQSVAHDGRRLVDRLFPESVGRPVESLPATERPPLPQGAPEVIRVERGGYLQSIDEDEMFSAAEGGRCVVRLETGMGHFLLPGEPLASVWFDDPALPAKDRRTVLRRVEKAIRVGGEWTLDQDLERALVELSDIAVRALSPALNDPTTATLCVDRLGELLTILGQRPDPSVSRSDDDGTVRLIVVRFRWDRAVGVAFEKIRHHAANSPSVIIRLIRICGRVGREIAFARQGPLREQLEEAVKGARRELESDLDLQRVEEAYQDALADLEAPPRSDA
jgi:uncharacterized membrane protein